MHLSWKLQDIVGYSPRSVAAGGRTPLHVAAERGFADVAEVSWLGAMGPSDSMEGSHHFQTWSCTVKMPGISELPIHPGFHPFFCRLCWRMAQNLRIAQRHRVGLRGLRGSPRRAAVLHKTWLGPGSPDSFDLCGSSWACPRCLGPRTLSALSGTPMELGFDR